MCVFKSMLLLKDKVFCPNYDSHEEMINETGMEHGPMRENYVRVEITPPDDDLTAPIDKWEYKVDQDYLPEWYVEEVDRPRCFDALKAWAVKHILIGQDVPEVKQGEFVVLINCSTGIVKGTVQKVWGGTVQEVWSGTVQEVRDGGTVQEVRDGGTVQKVWSGGTVQKVWSGGTVQEVWSGGTVQKVWGGGIVQKQTGGIVIYADGRISVYDKRFYRLITPEEMK